LYPRASDGVNELGSQGPFARRDRAGRWPLLSTRSFPEPLNQKLRNLWILWKTQDVSVLRLWITPPARLLATTRSARIGPASRGVRSAFCTFKTPVQTAVRRCPPSTPSSHPGVIHNAPSVTGASSSLIHRPCPWKGSGKGPGCALHPSPSVSAMPAATSRPHLSTPVERVVDNQDKPQVTAYRGVPAGSETHK